MLCLSIQYAELLISSDIGKVTFFLNIAKINVFLHPVSEAINRPFAFKEFCNNNL